MKLQCVILFFVLIQTLGFGSTSYGQKLHNLRCELMNNPRGIDRQAPRLSWEIQDSTRGVYQIGYHVIVSSSLAKLEREIGDLWDSGKVNSNNSTTVYYAGQKLESRQQVYWKVRVYTNKQDLGWSAPANWTTGLRYYKDWKNRWIGLDGYQDTDDEQKGQLSGRYFRKDFETKKKVQKATAYIMGLGLYELSINGKKIGDHVLAPTPTDYSTNIKYNVFDVTSDLTQGENTIGVILGNGRFYAMRQAKPYKVKSFGFPKLQFQLEIQYNDGSTEYIESDNTWKVSTNGPITSNNEYDGEDYDARKEFTGWDMANFDDHSWQSVNYVQEPAGRFEAQLNAPMKVMMDIHPAQIIQREDGKLIIDYGQNFTGWVKLKVSGPAGTQVKLRFAESLDEQGNLFVANLRDAKSTDHYTLKGEKEEEWEPKFTYHGFRYVEVSNYPGAIKKENFVGRFVYDDMATIGSFQSSDSLLNRIYKNAWWGIASNYKGMPIDCPQRNERQPWLGDRPGSAYGETFLFDNINFYCKWLDDIKLSQKDDGSIPDVAPAFWRYYSDNSTWAGTYIIVAHMLYKQSGDIRILKDHYPAMKKWINYMQDRYNDDSGLMVKDSYGDWCFPPESIEAGRGKIADKKYPSKLLASATFYHLLTLMGEIGDVLQDKAADQYAKEAVKVKKAFNQTFNNGDGTYGSNSLTENILAYNFDLVEVEEQKKVRENITNLINHTYNGHLHNGVVGIQWLMRALHKMGEDDLALKIATQKTYPSWGYMIEQGATTIWELWNGNTAHPKMNSQNHVMMLGDLLVWYYEQLAGIASKENAFQVISMKPVFPKGLEAVKASYQSLYGEITSDWQVDGQKLRWQITIPPNTEAEVFIPARSETEVFESGKHLNQSEGIEKISRDEDYIKVSLKSGNYLFNSHI